LNITKKQAILLAAIILVPAVVTVFAQPSGINKEKTHLRPLLLGQGFAINPQNETDYHVLDISAMGRSNSHTMSYVKFAGQAYALNITSYDNQSLSGDILTMPPSGNKTGFIPDVVGKISLSMSKFEGVLLSKGTITMNGTNYNVLLTSPVMVSGWQHKSNGMFGMHYRR